MKGKLLLVAAGAVLGAALTAAILRTGAAPPSQLQVPPARQAITQQAAPLKPVASSDPVDALLGGLRVAGFSRHEDVGIFALAAPSARTRDYVTLDQALRDGSLSMNELPGKAEVNSVQVANGAKGWVFAMSGEIFAGAKQDRTLQQDALFAPSGGQLVVPVFCTEHHRWATTSKRFEPAYANVPQSVRRAARVENSQSGVWESNRALQSRLGVNAATAAAKDTYAAAQVQRTLRPYQNALKDLPAMNPDIVGVIVTHGRTIVCLDVFASHDLLLKLWPKLLQSYTTEAAAGRGQGTVSLEEAQRLLVEVRAARRTPEVTHGAGSAYAIRSDRLDGSALLDGAVVVHLDAFPTAANLPAASPGGMDLGERRRERIGH